MATLKSLKVKKIFSLLLLGPVELLWLFLQQFIGHFGKEEAMPCSDSPQIAFNAEKMAKKCCPLDSFHCFYSFMTRMRYELFT